MDPLEQFLPRFCEKCGTKYNNGEIEITPENNGVLSMRAVCSNCRHQIVLKVAMRGNTMSGAKQIVKSDLTSDEMVLSKQLEPLIKSELLEFYESIEQAASSSLVEEALKE